MAKISFTCFKENMVIKLDIPYRQRQSASDIISAFNSVKSPIQTILNSGNKTKIKTALGEINAQTGMSDIASDSVSFLDGTRKIILSSENPYSIKLAEQNTKTSAIERDLFISNNGSAEARGFDNKTAVENFVSEVCEMLDFPLLKLRRMFGNDNFVKFLETFSHRAVLSPKNMETANEIIALFGKIDKHLMSIENQVSRSTVKNGYPSIKTGVKGSKQLTFSDLNGRDYTVNVIADHQSQTNLVIKVTDSQNNTKYIIIEPDGRVLKSKKINRKCIIGDKPEFYSQKELDAPEIQEHLSVLKSELEKYDEYVLGKIEGRNNVKAKYSTSTVGVISNDSIKIIKDIYNKYLVMRKALLSLKDAVRKNLAKKKLGVQTVPGHNQAILYKNAGPYQEDIHLSFPVVAGKPSVKILVLGYQGRVKESFFIQDGKLVKFDANNTSRSKRADIKFNYHTQEEIDASNLRVYLEVMQKRLADIVSTISKGAGWYR